MTIQVKDLSPQLIGLLERVKNGEEIFLQNANFSSVSRKCSLNVGRGFVDHLELLARAFTQLQNLELLDRQARKAFLEDGLDSSKGIVAGFIGCHFEDFDEEIVDRLFGDFDTASPSIEVLLMRLNLCGIGIHMEKVTGVSINLDYSFNPELSDELLVARWRKDVQELTLAHES